MVKAKKSSRKVSGKRNRKEPEGLSEELIDEVDAFHSGREKIPLNAAQEEYEEDSDDVEGIYNIDGMSEDSEGEDSEEDDGGEKLRRLEAQEKAIRAQLQLQQGAESDEDSEEEEDPSLQQRWGKKKGAYYGSEEEDDADALAEEEEEGKLLQEQAAARLKASDFGVESSSSDEEADEDADTLERQVMREEIGRPEAAQPSKDSILADASELQALLSALKDSLEEARSRVGPLVKEVRQGQLATAEGVSYLETKNLLLLHYCLHMVFYILLKAEGRPVRHHPVIARLVEIRTFLDKIRPLDKKLRYQMDKLLTSQQLIQANAASLEDAEMDPLQFRPNPEALVPRVTANEGNKTGSGVYKPPMLNPIAMEEDPDKEPNRRERRAAAEKVRRSARSQLVADLAREINNAPDELREQRVEDDSAFAARQRERLQQRASEEEELMMRVPLAKREKAGLKAARKAGAAGGMLLDDFADDVADLVKASNRMDAGAALSQKFGADLSQQQGNMRASGDADLPTKPSLATRRARVDNAKAKQKRPSLDSDDDFDDQELPLVRQKGKKQKVMDQDNEFYDDVARAAQSKKAEKRARYSAPELHAPLADETTTGPRKISRAVEKNKGLTPHRKKEDRNPRVKGRKKFEKATIRRKGQVQDVRNPAGPYGGEQTGIKSSLSRSTRF